MNYVDIRIFCIACGPTRTETLILRDFWGVLICRRFRPCLGHLVNVVSFWYSIRTGAGIAVS